MFGSLPFFLTPPATGFFPSGGRAADATARRPGSGPRWEWADRRRRSVEPRRAREASRRSLLFAIPQPWRSGPLGESPLSVASSVRPIEDKRVLFLPVSDGPFVISRLRPSGGGKGAAEGVSRGRLTSLLYDQPPAFLSFKIILTFIKHFQISKGKNACHTEAHEIWTHRGTHRCLF